MDEDDKKDLVSCYLNFRLAYESRGGDKFDFPTGDSFLRFIHIHGYDTVRHMTPEQMAEAIRVIDGRAETECSGNITKENIKTITSLGVDYVSSGALTHSAPILDISLKHLRVLEG